MSRSSAVPGAAAVLHSPAGRPEGAEPAQAETDEAAGSDQPTHPGSPAQVTPQGAWSAVQSSAAQLLQCMMVVVIYKYMKSCSYLKYIGVCNNVWL